MTGTPHDAGLALLLDRHRLSGVVGEPVHATRLRPKPGVSTVAALLRPDGSPWGWVRSLSGTARDKAGKALEHARTIGRASAVAHLELAGEGAGTLVQWGPVETDPRLGRSIARLDLGPAATLLRHNPLRRVVVRERDAVHRVTATPHRDRLVGLARSLAGTGVPVVAPLDRSPTRTAKVSSWPWVEGRDAAGCTDPEVLGQIGTAVARLHATDPGALEGTLAARTWADVLGAAAASVRQLDLCGRPDLPRRAERVLSGLGRHVPEDRPLVVSHGDLSLDQVLLPVDGGVLLTDLDRAALAPRELDLASLTATCLLAGHPLPGPVLEGYDAPFPVSGEWVAAALLARVAEPWRAQGADWVAETARLLDLADAQVDIGSAARGPVADVMLVPTSVDDGTGCVSVDRAWPGKVRDGIPRVVLEGRDAQGRLRAGTWDRSGRTRLLPPGADPELPALAEAAHGGELVVHRAGRRAVVRHPDAFVKVVRPGRGPELARATDAGHRLAALAGLDAPRLLDARSGHGATPDAVRLTVVPGRPLHDLSGLAPAEWVRAWDAWARSWTRLQDLQETELPDLPVHTGTEEARVLRAWAGRAGHLLEDTGWPARLEELARLVEARPATRLVPTHRDLHDKQLLWDGADLGVLDLDTACRADPALDPANLAVHASLRQAQGIWSGAAADVVRARAWRVARAAGVDAEGWALAAAATVARLVAVYAFRPRWAQVVLRWAEDVDLTPLDERTLMDVSPGPPARTAS